MNSYGHKSSGKFSQKIGCDLTNIHRTKLDVADCSATWWTVHMDVQRHVSFVKHGLAANLVNTVSCMYRLMCWFNLKVVIYVPQVLSTFPHGSR